MAEPDPLDQALDLLVFAPLGLLASARELVPKLAEKGRAQVASRAPAARMVGQLAVRQAPKEARRIVRHLADAGGRLVDERLGRPAAARPGAPAPTPPTSATAAGVKPPVPADSPASTTGTAPPGNSGTARRSATHLGIPGYDSLSASQVIARLDGLTPAELDDIRAYEQSGRARRTVLTRISQLRPPPE